MHPDKVKRESTKTLKDLPNIGPSLAEDLRRIGIKEPEGLIGRDPVELYKKLGALTGVRPDPCVLDVFMSITDFMNGGTPKVWWSYTQQRKRMLGTST